jgi:hypothetical protein
MLNFQLALQPQTQQRLEKILQHSNDAESFAQSIIAYQITQLQKSLVNLKLDLLDFEKNYQLSSEQFYQQFMQGELADEPDFMVWSGLYELFCDNQLQLNELND